MFPYKLSEHFKHNIVSKVKHIKDGKTAKYLIHFPVVADFGKILGGAT